ncbi:MAG: hypothetical protein JWP22_1441 [Ramlibacter sp.]|jgi:hypothetical protein|nr:hypothetical protein [Ramlibacter sp.]MDB5912766.1 hypothetical protein [Ramlibacter sp.]
MNTTSRQAVWILLSELFVDTEHTKDDLRILARSLQETGFPLHEIETILCREVAPVCGRWMLYPGAIGPWPAFQEQELRERIDARLHKPWYKPPFFHTGLWGMPGVRREWTIVRNALRGNAGV